MAKKRYYQSKKDRGDSDMISADYSAPSNMPQQVMMKQYPMSPYMEQGGYRDTYKGIDWQIGADVMSKAVKKNGSRS